ncbi:unnamed protein product [Lactuca saligna]|uniref:Proline-rich protein PRCC n=1 Tax=Lactuca saligna TaxID=75948 RepID=A0AA35YCM6_LACSI|nr:unnamed protein product [Lactuca saligna]
MRKAKKIVDLQGGVLGGLIDWIGWREEGPTTGGDSTKFWELGFSEIWIDKNMQPEISKAAAIQNITRVPGKRGRNEIPHEIIEVSQDELVKNQPQEDQFKSTGIAFGSSYQNCTYSLLFYIIFQPASSGKGKPTKLHKRKHHIGSLYFDMRSKEMELAERRSKGFLTKAKTQAKYGW